MLGRKTSLRIVLVLTAGMTALEGAAISRQQADVFAKKMAIVNQQGTGRRGDAARRTPFTEAELNSWFAYRAQPHLPPGVTQPSVTIVGNGKVIGGATVDLEAVAKRKATGGAFNPWSYLGGRVPLTVTGILHTKDGRARFELQQAEVSGVPIPTTLLQELVSYYSRTPDDRDGIRLDDPFVLPARIRQIEVGTGQAVVVQ